MDLDYHPDAPRALDGVRVLDRSRLAAGDAIFHEFADHGAVDGRMVEVPVAERARAVLRIAVTLAARQAR